MTRKVKTVTTAGWVSQIGKRPPQWIVNLLASWAVVGVLTSAFLTGIHISDHTINIVDQVFKYGAGLIGVFFPFLGTKEKVTYQ